ncbi:MAG: AmmeMemoRadiSam system protein B [Spirochaetota bacterium]
MGLRRRALPAGWYPGGRSEVLEIMRAWEKEIENSGKSAFSGIAGVVPHAGWTFSGKLAFSVFKGLEGDLDSIVVVGGHLPPSGGILTARESEYETPLGNIAADLDLLNLIEGAINCKEDVYSDNTVEIQMPFIKYLFPSVKTVGLRAEPGRNALNLGEVLCNCARKLKKKIAVVGSTDLTHYGPSYGFSPAGKGKKAEEWVMEINDRKIIEALLSLRAAEAIELAVHEKSACSAGGAAAAAAYASGCGVKEGVLIDYYTSLKIHSSDSFVGYAGIIYG